jgi:alpha/beta hydrolase family protein
MTQSLYIRRARMAPLALITLFANAGLFWSSAHARITELLIDRVESPTFEGLSFGQTGQYEKLVGRARGAVDPVDPSNSVITDISLAPRNPAGLVEYETQFFLLKPIDIRSGNRNIFYNVVNRGNKGGLSTFNRAPSSNNPTTAADAGDGLLMRQGYAILWSAWQPDVLPGGDRMTMRVPVAVNPDGSEITGELRAEYIVNAPTNTQNLGGGSFTGDTHASYETVSLDTSTATLTRRMREADPRVLIPGDAWAFADCTQVPFPGVPSTTKICLRDGFGPDFIYELIYTAKNPLVLGLGFAATRDLISFFRRAMHDDAGHPNPLAIERHRTGIRHALIMGSSQSGRYVRSFIHLGFNADENGQIVFEGAFPHISPGRIPLNVRFGPPGRVYLQHEDHVFPAYEATFTYSPVFDPNTGRTDGILVRCEETHTCPKIVHAMSSLEFWQGRQSLDQTDPLGTRDLSFPENVRMYLMSSTQHGPALRPPPGTLPDRGICRWPANYAPQSETMRALWVALDRWVNEHARPPASRIPRIRENTLVGADPATFGFPDIPATTYVPNYPTEAVHFNGLHNALTLLDYGPEFDAQNESGNVTLNPPRIVVGRDYGVLLPAVDGDGNDVGGVRSTEIQAPLGTYTGWSRRRPGFAADEQCGLTGLYIPFARSQAEREAAGDSRLSLEERYADHDGYVAAVRAAAERLVSERLLLAVDGERLVQGAQDSDVLR